MSRKQGGSIDIKTPVYAMATVDGQSAELTMYGTILEQRPTDWEGNPMEGAYILLDEFMTDLEKIAGCTNITIRMNSYGGDAGVANTIHNRLRELARGGATLTCVVDGVAMSGGSLIMCACDHIEVIHQAASFLFGYYNASDVLEVADSLTAYDKMQAEIYRRKTGLSATVIRHMMEETTYMTGREAVEKGFADEIIEDAEPLDIAASADGRALVFRGKQIHLAPGTFAPDNIPTVTPEASATVGTNKEPATTGEGGGNPMTLAEFRAKYPEAAAELEAEARAAETGGDGAGAPGAVAGIPAPAAEQREDAAQAERQRIQEIDALAGLYDAETINAAKYGDTACTAQEMTYRAAQAAAKNGKKFLAAMEADIADSGAQDVTGVDSTGGVNPTAATDEAMLAQARADAKAFNEHKKEVIKR